MQKMVPDKPIKGIPRRKGLVLGPRGPDIDARVVFPLVNARHITEIVLKVHG